MFSASRRLVSQHPIILSIIISVTVLSWMLSGSLQAEDQAMPVEAKVEQPLVRVQVAELDAQLISQDLTLYGRSQAVKRSTLSAEVDGRIKRFMIERGAYFAKGDALVELDRQDRESQLARAKALLEQRQVEFKGVQSLNKKGFQGDVQLAQAKALLIDADASVKKLQLDLKNTVVKAPYRGVFNDRHVELGGFVKRGDPIMDIADTSRLLIHVDVSERDIAAVRLGAKARVELVTSEVLEGKVSFIAKVSNPNTMTFKVEVSVDNKDLSLFPGMSARVYIPLRQIEAIKVTPAALALNDDGILGVKTVVDQKVQFVPARVVKTEADGAWLSGFSGKHSVIVLGQGFVRAGDKVEAVAQVTDTASTEVN